VDGSSGPDRRALKARISAANLKAPPRFARWPLRGYAAARNEAQTRVLMSRVGYLCETPHSNSGPTDVSEVSAAWGMLFKLSTALGAPNEAMACVSCSAK
jgi:hypothetical protein